MAEYEALAALRAALAEDDDPSPVDMIPQYEGPRHASGLGCWCGPMADVADPRIIIHRACH